ncbi:phosphotriesterase [Microbacterium invictum]
MAGADLGVTLVHEHLFVTDPELDACLPHPEWDEERAVAAAVTQLEHLHALGVRTVVDLTVPGLGRNVARVRRVADQVPVNIVVATGYYRTALAPFFALNGPGLLVDGPDPLVELFLGDIENGIEGSGIRAGMIKIASDAGGVTPDVARVFAAAAVAHRRTGVPITTHSHSPSRGGLAQQDLLSDLGVPLDRVVIGHAGDSTEPGYVRRLADRGSWLGFDRFGMTHMQSDEARIRTLLDLLHAGYTDQLLLSHDAAVFSRITPPSWRAAHAPRWRMDTLHRAVLPRLRADGVDEATLTRLMVDNPRRLLTGEARSAISGGIGAGG